MPRATGFDALVWVLPVAALVCAAGRPGVTFRRWKREAATEVDPTDDDRELVATALRSDSEAPPTSAIRERRDGGSGSPGRARGRAPLPAAVAAGPRRRAGAGDVDAADYETLRDGYTKRAADVLRAIEEGRAALPPKPPGRWRRTLLAAAIVVVVAVGAGILVARTSGQRSPGQTITGGVGTADTATLLAQARTMFGVDARGASDLYRQVLEADPRNVEALTYQAWLIYINSVGANDELRVQAVETARQQLTRAVEVDPDYADPHCFLAVFALRVDDDAATSQAETDRCLELDPPALIRSLMQQLTAPSASSVPATSVPG